MTPSDWPMRFMVRRSTPLWTRALITAAAYAAAVLIRGALIGFDNAAGLSSTYFPAFIVVTLYAGARWGWAAFAVIMIVGYFETNTIASTVSRDAIIFQFGLSGAATVLVAAALREALLRLEEAKVTEEAAKADLVATEARFRTLADSAPILMWLSNTDGTREFVNRAYLDFLGLDYDSAMAFDWRRLIHPEDLDRIAADEALTLASGGDFIWEARYRRGSGDYVWIRSVSQHRYLPNGELAGYVGVGYDITDAKRAEADLTRINDLLAERVQAALSERDEAEAALQRAQKLEAVGQLTGGVAHDFNNLLTVIIGAMDLIRRHPHDEVRRERMIEAAQGAARRGERLTQQLLAFSRRQDLKPQLIAIDSLLAESEPLLRQAVGEAVTLAVEPAAAGAVAHVDASQFEAAVMNLVVNARDATPPGGVIRVETRVCAIEAGEVENIGPGEYLCIAVHDTGQGMDEDTMHRVFEPFFTTKELGRGTGLGLSQVYGFARQSGGAVTVESSPGKGASIRIYLPRAAGLAERPSAQATTAKAQGPARNILLVEDDAEVGEMVEAMLTDLGHSVRRAAVASEALAILKGRDPIDLMLTDLVMPGGRTGVELAHDAARIRPTLPIVLTSGYTAETLGPAVEAPWPLLRKPYSREALAAAIESLSNQPAPAASAE